jgi:hypothetical protein
LVGNVNGNGIDTIPLHAVGFEGYLDGGLNLFVILIAMVGLSQYMQPSKEFHWRAIVCKAQCFVCMIGRSNISQMASHKVIQLDAFVVGYAVAWLVGNVNGNGNDPIPLHAVGFEGYLDGGLKWFVILIVMVGLSQYMQPSKELYWRAIVCKAQYFVCMIGRSNISCVVSHKGIQLNASVVSYDMNVFAHVLISGFFEVNRRVKLQLLSIAFEDKHGCFASAKALHLLLGCWSVPLIVQADDHASQIKSSCSFCLWTGSKSAVQIIP